MGRPAREQILSVPLCLCSSFRCNDPTKTSVPDSLCVCVCAQTIRSLKSMRLSTSSTTNPELSVLALFFPRSPFFARRLCPHPDADSREVHLRQRKTDRSLSAGAQKRKSCPVSDTSRAVPSGAGITNLLPPSSPPSSNNNRQTTPPQSSPPPPRLTSPLSPPTPTRKLPSSKRGWKNSKCRSGTSNKGSRNRFWSRSFCAESVPRS